MSISVTVSHLIFLVVILSMSFVFAVGDFGWVGVLFESFVLFPAFIMLMVTYYRNWRDLRLAEIRLKDSFRVSAAEDFSVMMRDYIDCLDVPMSHPQDAAVNSKMKRICDLISNGPRVVRTDEVQHAKDESKKLDAINQLKSQ